VPIVLLIGAYIHMAFRYDKIWLFNTIVHERGKYTLLEVIFYFRHFLWELPIKTVYAFFLVGTFFYFGRPETSLKDGRAAPVLPRQIIISIFLALATGVLAFLMTTKAYGFHEALAGLIQSRISELKPLAIGSHWRNHFLSNIVLYLTSISSVLLYRLIEQKGAWQKRRFGFLLPLTAAFFVIVTLLFGVNLDPFQVPSYLGHQLREIFGTDLTITMLLSIGILIHLESKFDSGNIQIERKENVIWRKNILYIICSGVPAVLISSFLVLKVLTLNIKGEMAKLGSTAGWSKVDLFAWHFFEHSLDYFYAGALVYFLYLTLLKIDREKRQL
jgi:hypothetical protein